MKEFLLYFSIVFFAIFIGSQITEGVLLVPYWQYLSSTDFYAYYNKFGPSIIKFYTILTVIAVLIPISLSVYCKLINSNALKYSLISSFFTILFISSVYIYFNEANESFYQAAFSDIELKNELIIWSYWHWGRIIIEFLSLFFLIISVNKLQNESIS